MINLRLQGGLGNQLFQYCSARVLANESRMFLYSPRIEGFKNIQRFHRGKISTSGFQKIGGHSLPDVVSKWTVLEGYFQRIELLDTHKDDVVNWLELGSIHPDYVIGQNDLTLSIRRGSTGWPIELCPNIEYYIQLLEGIEFKRLWITTDSPEDPYFIPLIKKYANAQIVRLDTLNQFKFIQNSPRIIVAPSTFSILASWSSKASRIYWPRITALDFTTTDHNWYSESDSRNEYIG